MADLCVLFNTDSELMELKSAFEKKFKDVTKLLGDDCAIFSSVSNLLKDASNVAGQWEKELKGAVADVVKIASDLYDNLLKTANGILESGLKALKDALSSVNSAFDSIGEEVKNMMNAIKEALDSVKMAVCDTISDAIKSIPAEIVAVSAAAAMVKGYDFVKDASGKNIIGKFDVDNITTNVLSNLGIHDMKKNIMDKVSLSKNIDLNKLKNLGC